MGCSLMELNLDNLTTVPLGTVKYGFDFPKGKMSLLMA
jgi:hypothetical protein